MLKSNYQHNLEDNHLDGTKLQSPQRKRPFVWVVSKLLSALSITQVWNTNLKL